MTEAIAQGPTADLGADTTIFMKADIVKVKTLTKPRDCEKPWHVPRGTSDRAD